VISTPTRVGIAETQNALEDGRDFEYRAIRNARDVRAKLIEAARYRGDAAADRAEGIEHDARRRAPRPVAL